MFDFLRTPSRKRSVVIYVVFGLISLVFVFMGSGDFLSSSNVGGFAAVVNNERISIYEYRSEYRERERYFSRFFGNNMNRGQVMRLRQMALENLIQQEVLAQAIVDDGLFVSDTELAKTIMGFPAFQENGIFNKAYYERYLSSQRLSAFQFEKNMRRGLLNRKVTELFDISVKPSQIALDLESKIGARKVNVEFVDLSKIPDRALKISPKELSTYMAENLSKIEEYYNKNLEEYTEPEKVKARHILVRIDPKDPKSEEKAFKKIQSIKKDLKIENFSAMAKEHSADPGSKEKGGDLGFFAAGEMVKEFSDAAFKLEPNKISPPVKTSYGYHIIMVDEKKAKMRKKLEEVKGEIAQSQLAASKTEDYYKRLNQLLADGSIAKFKTELKRGGFKWEETGPFDIGIERVPKVGQVEGFVEAAFRLSKAQKYPSKLLKDGSRYLVMRFKKDEKVKIEDNTGAAEGIARQMSQDVLTRFTKVLSDAAKIERNPKVLDL